MEDQPVSPTGQYFTSSAISISVIAVLESEIPIDDSMTIHLLNHVFLPINPRFSSIMVKHKNGRKHWKPVQVNLQEHIHVPFFPDKKSPEFYDQCFTDYLTKIAGDHLPQTRPLWEIHIIKYPTLNSAGNLVFKLHHALGDGYSLMGALLSCLQRAENPKIPLTFPSAASKPVEIQTPNNFPAVVARAVNTVTDLGWSLLKSTVVEDDRSPIRSGDDGVQYRPITITTITFSLDRIKQVKDYLHATINDVICGVMFLGIRMYMKSMDPDTSNAQSTALVLLNTRNICGYKSVSEMVAPDAESPWGNQFAFLHVSVPQIDENASINPLSFVVKAQDIIKRKRNSAAVVFTGKLLDAIRKYRGPEVTAKYIHSTLKNASMTLSNMMGPIERMALANHPIKGLYFMVLGSPQSLTITMMSYMGELRVAVGTENGLIEASRFKTCIEDAFDIIYEASKSSSPLKLEKFTL